MENNKQNNPTWNPPAGVKLKEIEKGIFKSTRNKIIAVISIFVIILAGIGGLIYWSIVSARIYIETASVSAPVNNLAPAVG